VFQKAVPTQDVTYPVSFTSFYFTKNAPYLVVTLYNTSLFSRRSVQKIVIIIIIVIVIVIVIIVITVIIIIIGIVIPPDIGC